MIEFGPIFEPSEETYSYDEIYDLWWLYTATLYHNNKSDWRPLTLDEWMSLNYHRFQPVRNK